MSPFSAVRSVTRPTCCSCSGRFWVIIPPAGDTLPAENSPPKADELVQRRERSMRAVTDEIAAVPRAVSSCPSPKATGLSLSETP